MFPILQIASLAIPVAPMVMLIGVFISASLVEHHAEQMGLDRADVSNMLYIGLGVALLGARLTYVAAHLDAFVPEPLSIFVPTTTTLDPLGGLIIGIGAGGLYGLRHKLPLWQTVDALAPGIATVGIVLGLAHLASGDAFGAPARLPWSIYLWDEYRHPSQIYELVAAISILAVWWLSLKMKTIAGFQFWVVVALEAASVVVLEGFCGDSILFQGWRVAQVFALAVLALSLVALHVLNQSASSNNSKRALKI